MVLKCKGNHEGSRSTCVMDMTINGDQQAWNDYRQRTQGACNSVPQVFVPALILDWLWLIGSTSICGGVTQLASWTSSTFHVKVSHTWEQPTTLLLLEWHVSCHASKNRRSTLANLMLTRTPVDISFIDTCKIKIQLRSHLNIYRLRWYFVLSLVTLKEQSQHVAIAPASVLTTHQTLLFRINYRLT